MARVMIFNGKDWEPLDWEAPAESVTVDRALNAPTIIELTLPPGYNAMRHKGFPLAYRDMSHVVVEDDKGGLYGGIVKESPLTSDISLAAYGHSVYAENTPWRGPRQQWTDMDSVVGFRRIWEHIIKEDHIPRLEVVGPTKGGTRVGKAASTKWAELTKQANGIKKFLNQRDNKASAQERVLADQARRMFDAGGRTAVGEVVTKNERPDADDAGTNKAVIEYTGDDELAVVAVNFWSWGGVGYGQWYRRNGTFLLNRAKGWVRAKRELDAIKHRYRMYQTRYDDVMKTISEKYPDGEPEPYEISWWNNRNLADTLNELADIGGFEWYDTGRWSGDDYIPGIRIMIDDRPVRQDVHLELGVNIHEAPDIIPQEVATHITAIGSGEGSATLRAERTMSHDRLVPVHRTVSNKDYRTQQLTDRAADAEMNKSRKALTPQLEGLTITDHPLAPISSFQLGDRIPVVGTLSDGSDLDAVVRVTAIEQDLAGNTLSVNVEGT